MRTFPTLKTGAVAQYPAAREFEFTNQVLRFVDGSEQRFRLSGTVLHRWEIRLDSLDETELASVEEFFYQQQGVFASFSFQDPWDGTEYPDCSIEADTVTLESLAELRGRTFITIRENRR